MEERNLLTAFDLAAYELNIDTFLANPFSPNDDEFSGVAYSAQTGTLFTVDDRGQGDIYEYATDGTPLREVDLQNFDSPEGIVHLGGDFFGILEEARREISIVAITSATTQINKSTIPGSNIIFLNHQLLVPGGPNGGSNDGPEGIAYDAANNLFYIAKEKNPSRLFVLDPAVSPPTMNEIVVSGLTGPGGTILGDLSDLYFADGDLFIVSDQSQKVIRVDLATNSVVGPELSGLPQPKFEGLTFTPDGFQMFLVSDSDDNPPVQGRRYLQYRNFTVFNPAAPALAAGSDVGVSTTDRITNVNAPTITGNAPGGSTVWAYVNGFQLGAPFNVGAAATTYNITLPTIIDGVYDVTVKVGESAATPEANRSPASPALQIKIDTDAPRVQDVIVANATKDFSVPAGSGVQLIRAPVQNPTMLKIQFDQDLADGFAPSTSPDLLAGDMQIVDGGGFGVSRSISGVTYDSVTNTATWTLTSALLGRDFFRMKVFTGVTDIAGNQLDGDWTNPNTTSHQGTSNYPSGNGMAGTDFEFRFTLMPGDAIGAADNIINIDDLNAVRNNFGTSGPNQPGDANFDGFVNLDDLNLVRNNFGVVMTTWPGTMMPMGSPGGGSSLLSTSTDGGQTVLAPVVAPLIGEEALRQALREFYKTDLTVARASDTAGRADLLGWELLGDAAWWKDLLGADWHA